MWCWKTLLFRNVLVDLGLNTLGPRQNGRHFADDTFKCIENVWIPINLSLKLVPKGPINNIPALVQIMAWRRAGDKPLSEPMVVSLYYRCIFGSLGLNELKYTFGSVTPVALRNCQILPLTRNNGTVMRIRGHCMWCLYECVKIKIFQF